MCLSLCHVNMIEYGRHIDLRHRHPGLDHPSYTDCLDERLGQPSPFAVSRRLSDRVSIIGRYCLADDNTYLAGMKIKKDVGADV